MVLDFKTAREIIKAAAADIRKTKKTMLKYHTDEDYAHQMSRIENRRNVIRAARRLTRKTAYTQLERELEELEYGTEQ